MKSATTSNMSTGSPAVSHARIGFREFVSLMAAMMAMNALAIDTMLPALPQIGRSLGIADDNRRQLIVTAFLLGFGGAQILYGSLSDRFGRRVMLLGGIGFYAVFSVGTALAPSFGMVLACRVLQGVAIASTRVVTVSVIRDCYGGRQMAGVMSLILLVFLAVPVLAPSLGQLLMLFVSWRGLFAALAIYAAIVFVWAFVRLPETLHPEYRRPIEVSSIAKAFQQALTTRQAVGYMTVQALLSGALFGFINSVGQIFETQFHAARLFPAVFGGIGAMIAAAALLNARIVVRLGTRVVSHAALLGFVTLSALHLGIALHGDETLWLFAVLQGLTMFCFGLTMGNLGAMAMEPLAAIAGTAASVQGFVTTVGGAIIGTVIGQSFNGTSTPMNAGFFGMGALALSLVLVTERGTLFKI